MIAAGIRHASPVLLSTSFFAFILCIGCNSGGSSAPTATPTAVPATQSQSVTPAMPPAIPAAPAQASVSPAAIASAPAQPGVNPSQGGAPPVAGGSDDSGPFAAGKRVFASNGCARCHTGTGIAGGPGGPMGGSMMGGGPMGRGQRPGGGPPGAGQPGGAGPGAGGPGGGQRPGGGMAGGPGGGAAGGPMMGGGGMARGPDLAKVGADPAHTPQWITEHIRNPKAHKPQSKMPSFAGKINEEDLKALAEFLASLKGSDAPSGGAAGGFGSSGGMPAEPDKEENKP